MAKNQPYKKRTGTLYRRLKGKDYSIDDPVAIRNGTIWLKYSLHGRIVRKSLKTTALKEAEKERDSIMLPLRLADEAEATAQLELKAKQAKEKLQGALLEQTPPLSVEKAWEAYLNSHERPDSGERTLRDYETHWNQFAEWLEANHKDVTDIRDITPAIASEYASHLTKKKLSPNTFNKRINFLKLLCTVLAGQAQLDVIPFEKIKSKKLKTESRRELTQHELKTVLESAVGEMQVLLYLGTFTGLRLGDCATLKWGEIDMDKPLIRRVPNKTRSRKPKPVTVGIPYPLYNLLNTTPLNKRKGLLLPGLAKLYQDDPNKLTRPIQQHFTDCGIQIHKDGTGFVEVPDPDNPGKTKKVHTGKRAVVEVGYHSLRHSFVSMHASLGTAQAVIMAIVGHGNPAMLQHYTHIAEESALNAAKALPDPTLDGKEIQDAEFEVIPDEPEPIPPWALDDLESMTSKNWKKIRDELVDRYRPSR